MRRRHVILGCFLVVAAGCGRGNTHSSADAGIKGAATQPTISDWAAHRGRQVSVVGRAESFKAGARLAPTHAPPIWLDDPDGWPDGYDGKIVRVTGTVVERHDLPVFIPKPGELPRGGIPVPPGTDLHQASRRYKLANYRIERVRS